MATFSPKSQQPLKQKSSRKTPCKRCGKKTEGRFCSEDCQAKAWASQKYARRYYPEAIILRTYSRAKTCARCRLDLPRGDFHSDRSRSDGLAKICKVCAKRKKAARTVCRRCDRRGRGVLCADCREIARALRLGLRYRPEHDKLAA